MAKPHNQQRRLIALGLTLVLHALIVGLLYWLILERKPSHRPLSEVLILDFGNTEAADPGEEPMGQSGNVEEANQEGEATSDPNSSPKPEPTPLKTEPQVTPHAQKPKAEPKPIRPEPKTQELQTQEHQESLKQKQAEINAKRQAETEARLRAEAQAAQRRAEEAKAKQEAEAKARAEAEAKRQADARQRAGNSVAQAFGAGRGQNTNNGNSSGTGNQGNSEGVAGGSFSLEGRRITSNGGQLMPPKVNKAIEGRVVVQIVVSSEGQVTSASVSPRGTTIADASVREEAIRAARSTTFNSQEGGASQKGTITYIYVIKE